MDKLAECGVRSWHVLCLVSHGVALPLARPTLRAALAEQNVSPAERKLLDNVVKRVRMWNDVAPFYPSKATDAAKTAESRGTESILNALILANYDSSAGRLSADAKLALDNMWSEQLKTGEAKGAWPWLQFHNAPWEGDSQYYGATLGALAVGLAPDDIDRLRKSMRA